MTNKTKHDYIDIDDKILKRLTVLRERSGKSAFALLSGARDMPDGLNGALVNGWFIRTNAKARQDHVEYVLRRWKNVSPIIPLTQPMIDALTREHNRTGVGAVALLKTQRKKGNPIPKGLKAAHIQHWLGGRTKTVPENHYEYVLDIWRMVASK